MEQLIKPSKEVRSQSSVMIYLEIKILFTSNPHLLICIFVLLPPKQYYHYYFIFFYFLKSDYDLFSSHIKQQYYQTAFNLIFWAQSRNESINSFYMNY